MTAQEDPYVRVYYRIVSDPKFTEVYADDRRLAAWLRLLLVADGTYPAPAPIPRRINAAAFTFLVEAGIIDPVLPDHYLIHGLQSERGRRSEQARKAAEEKWRRERERAERDAAAMRQQSTSNAAGQQRAYEPPMHSAPLRSAPLLSTPSVTRASGDANGTDDHYFDALGLMEELTQVPHVLPRGNKNWDRLARWIVKDGWEKVERTAREVADDLGGSPELNQLVNSLDDYLHQPLSGKRETPAQREEREMRDRQSKLNAEAAARRAPQGVA